LTTTWIGDNHKKYGNLLSYGFSLNTDSPATTLRRGSFVPPSNVSLCVSINLCLHVFFFLSISSFERAENVRGRGRWVSRPRERAVGFYGDSERDVPKDTDKQTKQNNHERRR